MSFLGLSISDQASQLIKDRLISIVQTTWALAILNKILPGLRTAAQGLHRNGSKMPTNLIDLVKKIQIQYQGEIYLTCHSDSLASIPSARLTFVVQPSMATVLYTDTSLNVLQPDQEPAVVSIMESQSFLDIIKEATASPTISLPYGEVFNEVLHGRNSQLFLKNTCPLPVDGDVALDLTQPLSLHLEKFYTLSTDAEGNQVLDYSTPTTPMSPPQEANIMLAKCSGRVLPTSTLFEAVKTTSIDWTPPAMRLTTGTAPKSRKSWRCMDSPREGKFDLQLQTMPYQQEGDGMQQENPIMNNNASIKPLASDNIAPDFEKGNPQSLMAQPISRDVIDVEPLEPIIDVDI